MKTYDRINDHFAELCLRYHVPVTIRTTTDSAAPEFHISEENDPSVITMNTDKIPLEEYPVYIGYAVRKVLLPRLQLETDRLLLRRFTPEDFEGCFSFLSNARDAYMDGRISYSDMNEEYHELIMLFCERESQYAITLKESSEIIGTVNVFADNSRAVDAMEIGYSIAHTHQRKGYAFEAVSNLLELLQRELYLELVTAGILPENTASEKLLLKLGFHQEGLRHKSLWHEALGKPVDMIYFYRDRQERFL